VYRTRDELKKITIDHSTTVREAIKIIDESHFGIVVIIKDEKVIGILTDEDIRRLILKSVDLSNCVANHMNQNPILIVGENNIDSAKNIFSKKGFSQIPVVNEKNILVDLIFISDLFKEVEKTRRTDKLKNVLTVIMAGGRGTRLEPVTTILPKPLIPINGRSMLEEIMTRFSNFGINDFCISVNYKANMIKAYLTDVGLEYNISYIQEDKPLGTAGSLHLLGAEKLSQPFFVSNCDIIIDDDYSKIYDFHLDGKYEVTLVASLKNYQIPYGVCEIENGGDLVAIKEKPETNYLVNTGLYVVNPQVLKLAPAGEFFHITHLVEIIKNKGLRVGVYPVSSKSWVDTGQWAEYLKVGGGLW